MGIDPVTTWHGALPDHPLQALVGSSAAVVRLRGLLEEAATKNDPVMIRGESGSGKTLAARALMAQAPRPWTVVRLRCGRASPYETTERLCRLSELAAENEPVGLLLDDVGDAPIGSRIGFAAPWRRRAAAAHSGSYLRPRATCSDCRPRARFRTTSQS